MTAGMEAQPFSTTPEVVAEQVVRGLERGPRHGVGPAAPALGLRRPAPPAPAACGAIVSAR